jgi:ZIP family zinc transporter
MNGTILAILGIFVVFLMEVLGVGAAYFFKNEISPIAKSIIFGISAGVMLASAFFSLLIPAITKAQESWGAYAYIWITLAFILGMASILLAGVFFQAKLESQDLQAKKLLFSMSLHNIPEGLALGFAFGAAFAQQTANSYLSVLGLAIGIGIQNIPEGAAVALPLKTAYKNSFQAFIRGVGCASVELLFGIIGYFGARFLYPIHAWLLAFSAGAVLFVTIDELLPVSKEGERSKSWGSISVLLGALIMSLLDMLI